MYKGSVYKNLIIIIVAFVAVSFTGYYVYDNFDELFSRDAEKVSIIFSHELDSDGDGLSDGEERDAGTNPYSIDSDGDGYPDNVELAGGYDPLELGDGGTEDSDGDGLTDTEESKFGTSPYIADSDYDGKEDGAEVIAGSDPTKTDFSYLLAVAESKAETDEAIESYVRNSEDILAYAEEQGVDPSEIIEEIGADPQLYGQVSENEYNDVVSTLGFDGAEAFSLDEGTVDALETAFNSSDLTGLQENFTSFISDSSLDLDGGIAFSSEVALPEISNDDLAIIEEYGDDDVNRYFTTVAGILSNEVPFTDADSFERFALGIRIEDRDDLRRVRTVFDGVLQDLRDTPVPNDERILSLHKRSIGFILASQSVLNEIESVDFGSTQSIEVVTGLLSKVNYLSNTVFSGQILPEIRSIISDYGLSPLIEKLDLAS